MIFLVTQNSSGITDASTYVGASKKIIYDPATNSFYHHYGKTLGGQLIGSGTNVASTLSTATSDNSFRVNYVSDNSVLTSGNINVAILPDDATITLQPPLNPSSGVTVTVVLVHGIIINTVITIDFTSQLINGLSDKYVINLNYGSVRFCYINNNIGWVVIATGI